MLENKKENFLITGGSGYVGKILVSKLISDERVGKIVVVDKDHLKEDLKNNDKVFFIHKNLVDDWEKELGEIESKNNFQITKVVHLAWQIRTMFGKQKLQNHWNIDGSQKVFDWVRSNKNISSLVHFSTVASYGAYSTNTFENIFTENNPFRKTNYLYAEEKRIVEENLDKTFTDTHGKNIFVIRPASITGTVGRERTGFGLQSALSGKIKNENFLFKIISYALQFMPATRGWARQFIHEEDIANASIVMSFSEKRNTNIEKYNLCPGGGYIDAHEMGEVLKKKVIYLHPRIVQVLCFLAWYGTLGKIPTSPGVWKAYAYPIIVDGSKIVRDFPEFKYSKTIREAYKG